MPPTIHLVRHAQGVHNLSVANERLPDPDLTPEGLAQCAALRASFPHHAHLIGLLASPLRRTLHTCLAAFGDHHGPVLALDLLQEVSASPCDTGSPPDALRAEFGDRVGLERVRPGWTDKAPGSEFEPSLAVLTARATLARKALRALVCDDSDEHIVVVSHRGFLHFLTEDWEGVPEGRATAWSNCEWRSYHFADASASADAALVETEASWRRRRLERQLAGPREERELRAALQQRVLPYLNVKA